VTDKRVFIILAISVSFLFVSLPLDYAYGAGGHDLPPSDIGDRQAFLRFNAPSIASGSEVSMSYSLIDESTGSNIQHVTYFLTVVDPEGQNAFSEVLHGHDGTVNVEFRSGSEGQENYKINANYDNLAASHVADQAGLITVVGPVFDNLGTYKVDIEVSGIDFDNTFLPEPLKYDYTLAIAEAQVFDVSYQEATFNVNIVSPSAVEEVTLEPERKQLIIQYPSGEWQHFDDFRVYVDIPNEMMYGPFTAVFNGMELEVSEERKDDKTTTLVLNGTHLDVLMNDSADGMEGMDVNGPAQQQNAIVITATSAVPEFPLALPLAAAGLGLAIVIAREAKRRLLF